MPDRQAARRQGSSCLSARVGQQAGARLCSPRGVPSPPMCAAHPCHLPHLIGPFEHYLWILKTTHSGKRGCLAAGVRALGAPPFPGCCPHLQPRLARHGRQPRSAAVLVLGSAGSCGALCVRPFPGLAAQWHMPALFSPLLPRPPDSPPPPPRLLPRRRRPGHQLYDGPGPDGWRAGLDHRGWVPRCAVP